MGKTVTRGEADGMRDRRANTELVARTTILWRDRRAAEKA